ncbi:MAG TPA: rhomboid family intramembrane serine protease [Rhodocyclaceae bacterium]
MYFSIPPLTRLLIVANVVVFLAETAVDGPLIALFALWPLGGQGPAFEPWQIVTYSFLHASLTHLLFNMFALFMFGSEIERLFGARRYFNLYLASVVAAALAQLAFSAAVAVPPYPTVGASGGIFGLLLAFGMYFPHRTIFLLFPPIPMPAWLFVLLYGALELFLGVTGTAEGVAHFAHLGGMLGAWLMLRRRRRW